MIKEYILDILGPIKEIKDFITKNSTPCRSYTCSVTVNTKEGKFIDMMYFENIPEYERVLAMLLAFY